MKKRCIVIFVLAIGLFLLLGSHISYSDSDSVAKLRTDLTSVESKVTEVYIYFGFVKKYILWILGAFGLSVWGGIKFIGVYVKKRFEKEIDKAIFKVDPTYLSVKIPSADFDHESERLKRLGFRNITTYQSLDDSCVSGCVIFKADVPADAEVLRRFILDKKVDQYQVGYVLYTRSRIDHKLFKEFNNITFANSPLTLVNAVYAVARGTIK